MADPNDLSKPQDDADTSNGCEHCRRNAAIMSEFRDIGAAYVGSPRVAWLSESAIMLAEILQEQHMRSCHKAIPRSQRHLRQATGGMAQKLFGLVKVFQRRKHRNGEE